MIRCPDHLHILKEFRFAELPRVLRYAVADGNRAVVAAWADRSVRPTDGVTGWEGRGTCRLSGREVAVGADRNVRSLIGLRM